MRRVVVTRAIREWDRADDPWPVVDRWAARTGYTALESDRRRRLYRKGRGRWNPSSSVMFLWADGRLHLEAWAGEPTSFTPSGSPPVDRTVEPGGMMLALPRRAARRRANALLRDLGAEPITEAADPHGRIAQRIMTRIDDATAASDRGDYPASRALWEELIPEAEDRFGSLHGIPLTARLDLAGVLLEVGESARALESLQTLVPQLELVLGVDEPATLNAREALAVALAVAGREGEVRDVGKRAVEDIERVFGTTHPRAMHARRNFEQRDWHTGKGPGSSGSI